MRLLETNSSLTSAKPLKSSSQVRSINLQAQLVPTRWKSLPLCPQKEAVMNQEDINIFSPLELHTFPWMVFSSWRKLVESPRSLPPISYQLLKNLASKSSKPSIMQVWLQHTWCQSSPRNHTMLIKDGAWWAQKASKVDQLQNKQNLHVFFSEQ